MDGETHPQVGCTAWSPLLDDWMAAFEKPISISLLVGLVVPDYLSFDKIQIPAGHQDLVGFSHGVLRGYGV